MKEHSEKPVDRREWFRGVLRAVSGAGLALLAGVLAVRRSHTAQPRRCPPGDPCGQCRKLAVCDEPRAREAKRNG